MADKRFIIITAILALALTLPAGCSKKEETAEAPPSAGEIIDKYVDTLTTAPDKARDARELVEERTEAEERALKAIE